ncbi:MAG: hypothetical protein IJX55_03980 [Clostridia bacterium]|nr:hypothetical protein [Clostridia bacterium]
MKEKNSELARLKRENAKLRRENEYLNHRIEKLSPKEAKNVSHEKEMFLSSCDVDKYKGYFPYLFGQFKFSLVYRIYDRIFFALRKIILASKIWRYLPIVLGVLGVILQSLLALGSVVVLLPVTAIISLLVFALSIFAFAKHKRDLLRDVRGRRIYFLYPAKKPKKDGFFYETMQAFAKDGVVFAVTSSITLCGIGAVRKVSENVYFVHTSFYYHFRKEAEAASADVVKVY